MFENTLEINRRVSNERVERFEREVLLVSVQEFCAPEFLIAEQIILSSATARERKPLHIVSHPDVVVGRIVQARMRGGGHDRRQMRRKFLRRSPLIEA